jgi:DNA-binding NarL/FixJ family response regulator
MTIRVLVAEDHPLVREGIVRALQHADGIDIVATAEDGAAAVDLAREHAPDVVVLDLSLPRLHGVAVLRKLRSEVPGARTLVLTADESRESVLAALDAGAAGYLSKRASGEKVAQAVVTVHDGGSVISPDLAGHLLRSAAGRPADPASAGSMLDERETEILRLVAEGLTDHQIASRLYLSPRTVQNGLARVRGKTGLKRREELARWAAEQGIA